MKGAGTTCHLLTGASPVVVTAGRLRSGPAGLILVENEKYDHPACTFPWAWYTVSKAKARVSDTGSSLTAGADSGGLP